MNRNDLLNTLNEKSHEFDNLVIHLRTTLQEKGHSFDSAFSLDTVGPENEASLLLLDTLRNSLDELVESYKHGLVNKPVSRCPFTGKILSTSVDTEGIDGLWWNSDNPIRLDVDAPKTFFAYDGAMKLNDTLESTLFPILPGPDAPFVLPRLLSYDQVKAVISQVNVGEHIGYLMTYFCEPFLIYEPRINDWGTQRYWEPNPLAGDFTTPGKWISLDPQKSELDFDLTYWMEKGKLFWIKPGDESLRLRVNTENCPFLNLKSNGKYQEVKQGQLTLLEKIETVYQSIEAFNSSFSTEELRRIHMEIEEAIVMDKNVTMEINSNMAIELENKEKEVTTNE